MSSRYALRSPVFLTNRPTTSISFVRDAPLEERQRSVDFHVVSGDYFGTLATIMGLMADAISGNDPAMRERCRKTLSELREDLIYLHENYLIERKR